MIEKIKARIVFLIFFPLLIFYIMIFCFQVTADEISGMSFEEVIKWGLENNHELNIIRNNINEIEKNIEIINAGESFQVDLSITPIWRFNESEENSQIIELNKNSFSPNAEVSLSATKQLAGNINLSTELNWKTASLYQENFTELTEKINADLRSSKKIYPNTPSENEKQVYSLRNQLEMSLQELKWAETEKQIEFIQDYLNIIRLQKQMDIARERQQLAMIEMIKTEKRIELGEGGYQQEAEAEINMEEASNNLFSIEQNLTQAKQQWALSLNLPTDMNVVFKEDVDLIKKLFTEMENLVTDYESSEILTKKIVKTHYQLKNSQIEMEELVNELKWTEDAGKPAINLAGGYDYPDTNWFIMLDFTMKLSDGGLQQLREEQRVRIIRQKEINITYLAEQLRLQAEQLSGRDEYNYLNWNTQKKALEKEQNRVDIIKMQYQQGVINEKQLKNAFLTLQEKEIQARQAADEWFINRLKLAQLTGYFEADINVN